MKPAPFEYHAAGSLEEAVALLAEHGDEAKVLAGGQSLIPLLSLRLAHPAHLVDINGLSELAEISDGGGLRLGAIVRQREAERSDVVTSRNPLLATALRFVAHTAIRTRGTVGGSVAHADPASELPAVLVAMDGEVDVQSSRGSRTISAADLYQGFLTTALAADELLTAVRLPAWPTGTGWSFQELSRRSGDFAIVGVATTVRMQAGTVAEARIAFSGVGSTPIRAVEAEANVKGQPASAELWAAAGEIAASALDPPSDVHGTTAYRRHLASVLARRSLQEAYERAGEHA